MNLVIKISMYSLVSDKKKTIFWKEEWIENCVGWDSIEKLKHINEANYSLKKMNSHLDWSPLSLFLSVEPNQWGANLYMHFYMLYFHSIPICKFTTAKMYFTFRRSYSKQKKNLYKCKNQTKNVKRNERTKIGTFPRNKHWLHQSSPSREQQTHIHLLLSKI